MPRDFVGKSTNYTKVHSMHRLYTTLHKTILGFADIGSMEKFFDIFSKIKKGLFTIICQNGGVLGGNGGGLFRNQ
jgi:hypothetical protein